MYRVLASLASRGVVAASASTNKRANPSFRLSPVSFFTMYTTNEEDQREAARLQARLQENQASTASERHVMPNVSIDEGKNKYVLISAMLDNQRQHFVVSRLSAHYHRNAAEPFVEALERSGYSSIQILGGGRIDLNTKHKTISIYGYSYGFGLADHALSQSIVEKDSRYEGFDISWSNEGY